MLFLEFTTFFHVLVKYDDMIIQNHTKKDNKYIQIERVL